MFGEWRWLLKEADSALRQGRLADAERLVSQLGLADYRDGRALADRLVAALIEQAETRLADSQYSDAWQTLERAEALAGGSAAVAAKKKRFAQRILQAALQALAQGEIPYAEALLTIAGTTGGSEARTLQQVIAAVNQARQLARQGNFHEAAELVGWMARRYPDWVWLTQEYARYRDKAFQLRLAVQQLYQAADQKRWSEVLNWSEQVLALVPQHSGALGLRRLAWLQVGPPSDESPVERHGDSSEGGSLAGTDVAPARRYLLWIDGVGGFLLLIGDHLWIGPPNLDESVALAFQGDIAERHAALHRNRLGYWIESLHSCRVNRRPIRASQRLCTGDVVELGQSVRFQFHQPHGLSWTARLEWCSGRRTVPSSDGAVLLADTCVLGPKPSSHIVCPTWRHQAVFYQRDHRLWCHASEEFQTDGEPAVQPVDVTNGAQVEGENWALTLEPA